MMRNTALAAVLALAASSALADEAGLPSMDYSYDGDAMGLSLGQVRITLKPEGAAGCYRYTNTSNPSGLVKMLYGSANQTSLFCLRDGRIRSQHFESTLQNDPKQSYTLDFDWDKHTVTDNSGQVRQIPDDAIDSFALQQAVRLWVLAHAGDAKPPVAAFTMVDAKNLTHYQFKFSGHQKIDTPAGSFDTLLMERIDNPGKIGRFWLAPDRGYMPVRSETKGGKALVTLVLAK
jgi:hypothetical protein